MYREGRRRTNQNATKMGFRTIFPPQNCFSPLFSSYMRFVGDLLIGLDGGAEQFAGTCGQRHG
jgi:hypothetical protein